MNSSLLSHNLWLTYYLLSFYCFDKLYKFKWKLSGRSSLFSCIRQIEYVTYYWVKYIRDYYYCISKLEHLISLTIYFNSRFSKYYLYWHTIYTLSSFFLALNLPFQIPKILEVPDFYPLVLILYFSLCWLLPYAFWILPALFLASSL